jgi:hypothetical protein
MEGLNEMRASKSIIDDVYNAAIRHEINIIRLLINNGADINARDKV